MIQEKYNDSLIKILRKIRWHVQKVDKWILLLVDSGVIFFSLKCAGLFLAKDIAASGGLHAHTYFLFLVTTLLALYFFDMYYTLKDFRRYQQLTNLLLATFFSAVFLRTVAFWGENTNWSFRFIVVYSAIFFTVTLLARTVFSLFFSKIFYKNALIIGANEISRALVGALQRKTHGKTGFGINVLGYLADEPSTGHTKVAALPCLGGLKDLVAVADAHQVSLLIYALEETGESKLNEAIVGEKIKGRFVISAITLYEALSGRVPFENMPSAWLLEDCLRSNKFSEIRIKRFLDVLCGSFFFVISIPVMLACAVGIKLESPGPVLFKQKRVGRFGKLFTMYKLRTMSGGAIRGLTEGEKWGHLYQANKNRITPWGGFLRKYHIDELPQFLNVILGDMSIVGPRPEMPVFIEKCSKKIPLYRLRLSLRPGITGWAQIWHGHTSTLLGYKNKFKYDLFYLANASFKLDLEIMLRTVFRILGYPPHRP